VNKSIIVTIIRKQKYKAILIVIVIVINCIKISRSYRSIYISK